MFYFYMNTYPIKPCVRTRNVDSIVIQWWHKENKEKTKKTYQLQILNEFKEWETVYWGGKCEIKVEKLGPCCFYNFRLKDDESDWIYFKGATETGPFYTSRDVTRAINFEKVSLLRKIANKRKFLLETENNEHKTPLIQITEKNNLHLAQILLSMGTNVNQSLINTGKTALMIAVYHGFLDFANYLIEKGANVFAADVNCHNILHYAVDSNSLHSVAFALEKGIDINSRDRWLHTPLHRAAIVSGSHDIIRLLIIKGADVTARDRHGFTYETHIRINQSAKPNDYYIRTSDEDEIHADKCKDAVNQKLKRFTKFCSLK